MTGGLEVAPGCQCGRKAKGEGPCSCALCRPEATFYSSISKIVWGISVLDIAAYWDKSGSTFITRFFSQCRFDFWYCCVCCYVFLSEWSTFLGSALPKDEWLGVSRQHQMGGIIFLLAHFALCKHWSCAFDFLFRQNKLLLLVICVSVGMNIILWVTLGSQYLPVHLLLRILLLPLRKGQGSYRCVVS